MKDNFKKLICGSLVALSLPVLAACGDKPMLSKPTGLSIDEATHLITWQSVQNAEYYLVEINGKTYQTTTESFPADDIISKGGKFYVRVLAVDRDDEFLQSDYSDYASIQNLLAFGTPVLTVDGVTLNWTDVGAEYYVVSVNGVKFEVTGTTLDLANLGDKILSAVNFGKSNSFSVYAKATSNNKKSEVSNVVDVYVAAAQNSPENVSVQKQGDNVTLSFDAVLTATSYTVKVNQTEFVTDQTAVDITAYFTNGFGIYSVSVKANKVEQIVDQEVTLLYMESPYSEVVDYHNKPKFVSEQVTGLVIENGVLTFDAVQDATIYKIYVNNTDYQSNTNSYNLASLSLPAGKYSVIVVAQNGEYTSLQSNETQYKVTAVLNTPGLSVVEQDSSVYLVISPVLNATMYRLQINQMIFSSSNTQVDITNYLVGGTNTISAIAVGDDDIYFNSAESKTSYVLLGAPQNLNLQNGVLSFDGVADCTGYEIYINENLCLVSNDTMVDISTYIGDTGVYQIKVRAVVGGQKGMFANFTHITTERLSAPQNLAVEQTQNNYVLTFDHDCQNVQMFDVYVNGNIVCQTNQTTIDITSYLQLGDNTIYVVAVGDDTVYLNSNNSASVTISKQKVLDAVSNLQTYAQAGAYYVSFDGVEDAESYLLEVYNTTSTNTFSKTIQAGELSNGSVHIDISAAITTTDTYEIKVSSQSSVQGVTGQANVITCQFSAYTQSEYAAKQYFYNGKDYTYVIKDEQELKNFVFYAVLYRLDSAEVYIDFDYDGKADAFESNESKIQNYLPTISKYGVDISQGDVLGQLFSMQNLAKLSEILGFIEEVHDQIYLYYDVTSSLTSQKSDCVYTLNFEYVGVYEATKVNTATTKQHANLPVNFVQGQYTRTFAIDSLDAAPVETVAQLLMVVQNGRKPQFVTTSKTSDQLVGGKTIAERTYLKAKEVLAQICRDDMTDYQKALAIYDWIITTNTYDNTTYSSAEGAPFSSDNLKEMAFYASGMLLNNLAVCKGISQAFSLMCNIEGIKTVDTFGITGGGIDWANVDFTVSSEDLTMAAFGFSQNPKAIATYNLLANIDSIGAHCWNRIYLDAGEGEQWYIVDATWGDLVYGDKQYLSHEYFLVNDSKIADNRKEFYPYGQFSIVKDENGNEINFAATGSYNYYKDSTSKINTYISVQSDLDAVVANMLTNSLGGFEVMFDSSVASNMASMLQTAFNNNGLNLNAYTVQTRNNYMFVSI